MNLRKTGLAAAASLLLLTATSATQAPVERHELFPYPKPPEGMTMLRERCNFLVYHFWERADLKKVYNQPDGLNTAFGDWISFMPYCAPDTARMAINSLLREVGKDGKKLLRTVQMAEAWTYSDTADFVSEELYRPFAAAAATSKKLSDADRKHYSQHVRRINASSMGQELPPLPYIAPDGTQGLVEGTSPSTMVVLADPDDMESTTAGIRFSIDPSVKLLTDSALLRIVWLCPTQPTEEGRAALEKLPDTWIKGFMPDYEDFFTLRIRPAVYLLEEHNRVILKDRPYQMALQVFNVMARGE